MSHPNWKRTTMVAVGLALSGFFLWLALAKVDAASLAIAFSTMDVAPVLLCAGLLALGIFLRSFRWRAIAGLSRAEQRAFARATNLGVFANLILPGRAGEVVRILTLAKLLRSSLSGPVASAFIDRLVDVIVLLASATFLFFLMPISDVLSGLLSSLLIVCCFIAAALAIYARSAAAGEALLSRLAGRWLSRWPLNPEAFLAELRVEFHRLFQSWLSVELVILAALILCADYGAVAALLVAFKLTLPLEAPLLLWVFLAAGSALPSAPGYVGVYQVAAVWALAVYSVPAATAVAVATVLQISSLVVALLMAGPGAVGAFKRTLTEKIPA